MSKELKAWFTVDELNAWAEKKLKENPQWAEQPAQQDIPDLIAGALGVSRGTAYDMMREALAEQPAQQEPVAAQSVMTVRIWRDKNSDQNAEFKNWHKLPDGEHILYTSPPAQRTWVGLTDEERDDLLDNYITAEGRARAIEAKLKEKNT